MTAPTHPKAPRRRGTGIACRWLASAACVACAGLCGCSGLPHYPAAPRDAAPNAGAYRLGTGDSLQIVVANNPELSLQAVPVRPDGKISVPFAEDVQAQGRGPAELARDLEARLQTYVRDPMVTVIVATVAGAYADQVRVVGEVPKPQSLVWREKMTLLDVMVAVGGLNPYAAGNSATLLRTSQGNTPYSVRVRDLVQRGDISANVEVCPGDILIVPQSVF